MKFYLTNNPVSAQAHSLKECLVLDGQKKLWASLPESAVELNVTARTKIYLFGEVFYFWKNPSEMTVLNTSHQAQLTRLFQKLSLEEVIGRLEGQYFGLRIDSAKKTARVFSDRYSREDLFYTQEDERIEVGTDLDFVIGKRRVGYDQTMLAHMFMVYGWYVPKGQTIYQGIKRLKVGEILTIDAKGIHSKQMEFKPSSTEHYTEKDLERYYKILKESVLARVNTRGKVWLSCSSGWDSSSLVGLLVQELGAKKVGTISGVMKYSASTDVINKFEIAKIKKLTSFYGIKPEFVDYDYKNPSAADYWAKVLPYYRARHMYVYSTYSMQRLSDRLKDLAGPGQILFNGESSDSFHNFGFSQFATFFHTEKSFTEYADKMNCYLYGPSFLEKVLKGEHERDNVYKIFKRMFPHVSFDGQVHKKEDLLEAYLLPFFYGSVRIPFAQTLNNAAVKPVGQESVRRFPYRDYMPAALKTLSPQNMYSWFIHLYHSFHAQGSSVNTRKYAANANGHRWRSPFNDYRLMDFLSRAPESWGRGLDFHHTKYPLKWVVQHKLRFPYETLAEGPHSYLYDVIEGFSLYAETTYRSGVTGFFQERLKDRRYRDLLSPEYFDLNYLDGLVHGFLKGQEVRGYDLNNLITLINLSTTGWY